MSVASNPIATGWLNENSLREFPFHEGCGLRPNDTAGNLVDGGWTIPNCLLVDMSVSVGKSAGQVLYLGQMSVVSGSVTLVFCDSSGRMVMSAYATLDGHEKNSSYQMAGTGSYKGASGIVCVGDLELFFESTPDGVYSFSQDETLIEPTCIRPAAAGVMSIRSVDSTGYTSEMLVGDVSLIAGDNIRIDRVPGENSIRISADPNSGYSEKCDCGESGQYIRTINGVSAEDVWIRGDDCIQVSTDGSKGIISISDSCSKPCCGCAETTFINQTINDLQTSVNAISGNVSALGTRLESFITSYVLSRKTLA